MTKNAEEAIYFNNTASQPKKRKEKKFDLTVSCVLTCVHASSSPRHGYLILFPVAIFQS
jgi:hypothetical protein